MVMPRSWIRAGALSSAQGLNRELISPSTLGLTPAIRIASMLALRFLFTAAVTAGCVWLLSTGKPLGGLVILPPLAIWVRHAAESGRLTRFARRFAKLS